MIRITISAAMRRVLQRILKAAVDRGDYGTTIRVIAVMIVGGGATIQEAAERVSSSDEAVRIWVKKLLLHGPLSLDSKKRPGRQPRLSKKQKRELAKIVDDGPEKCGFMQGGWNSAIIQQLIHDRFGVLYAVNYIRVCQRITLPFRSQI